MYVVYNNKSGRATNAIGLHISTMLEMVPYKQQPSHGLVAQPMMTSHFVLCSLSHQNKPATYGQEHHMDLLTGHQQIKNNLISQN